MGIEYAGFRIPEFGLLIEQIYVLARGPHFTKTAACACLIIVVAHVNGQACLVGWLEFII